MIKVILIDDEKHAILTLQHLLQKCDDVIVLDTITDSRKAKGCIDNHDVDMVFSDIEMPYLNGFDVLQQWHNPPFKMVFTTAYNQYAIQALKMNAFDYIMKPIELAELKNCLAKFNNNEILTQPEQVNQIAKFKSGQIQDTLALSTIKGLIFIKIDEISYLKANQAYTYVHMFNGEQHLVSKSIAIFEDVLSQLPIFFRAHKSFIINLKYIKQYNKLDAGEIIMMDDAIITLSRYKKQEFLSLFTKI